jgi:histidinol-phosphate aminotransferase
MSRFWSKTVQQLTPYTPGEQLQIADLIKLNTNENPYGPSPKAIAAMQNNCNDTLRLYPPPDSGALKETIAKVYDLNPNQVFVGNGSDEVLAHIFLGLFKQEAPLLFPDISYSFYPVYADLYEINTIRVPLNEQLQIQIDDYISHPINGGIIFPNPNAPTGQGIPLEEIERLLKANRNSVVVIDEAYVDFGAQSSVALINQYDNLLVTHSLSKSRSLAGLRVGYAMGHPQLIEGLERVKNSFNSYPLDRLAQAGAQAAVSDQVHLKNTSQKVIDSRNKLVPELEALGFKTLPSVANFVFTSHPKLTGQEIYQGLRDQKILVRHFTTPRIDQYVRITIGTERDCADLLRALKQLLQA